MTENNAAQAAEQAIKAAIRKAYDDGYNDAKLAPENCSTYCVERAVRLDSAALLSKLRAAVADERAAFEAAWRELNAPWPMNSRMHDDGRYATPDIEREWRLWQARAALASAPVAGDGKTRVPGDHLGGPAVAWDDGAQSDPNRPESRASIESKGGALDPVAGEAQPTDAEIIDLAVEPLGIDCDRVPHGVVVFARNLLSRYAAPQASEAVREQCCGNIVELAAAVVEAHDSMFAQCCSNTVRNAWGDEVSMLALNQAYELARAALSAQPGAQKGEDHEA